MEKHPQCSTEAFFCQIGKYQVLTSKQETIEIDRIYEYKKILAILSASTNSQLLFYLSLVEIRDTIAKKTGQKVQMSQWAIAAQISVEDLNSIITLAHYEWATIANITVEQLKLIKKDGVEARKNLVLCNLRLVAKIAKSYQHRGLDLLDLIQEGTIGLEHSIDRFDRTKGYRFTTYAAHWIKRFICKSIDDNSRIIRLPRNLTYLLSKIKKAVRELYLVDATYPSIVKISNYLNISELKIRYILEKAVKVSSVNIKIGDRADKELLDILPSPNQEHLLEDVSIQDSMETLILNLDFKERQVIKLRYLQDTRNTLHEIGKILEISYEGVRIIETKALEKLRQSLDLVTC